MQLVATVVGVALIVLILVDAFEAVILPRRVTRRWRLARLFTVGVWRFWAAIARRMPGDTDLEGGTLRDRALSLFAPLTLILLLGFWAVMLVIGFALVQRGLM